jgi:cystathionine beta-lyase/cystathionine gamma-synthase
MKFHTKAVHAGDRKRQGPDTPVTTPIYTAASYVHDSTERLDRIFGHTEHGYAYQRYDNPTNAALEEQLNALENGCGALTCASGMAALQLAILAACSTRAKSVLCAEAIYGATIRMLDGVFAPLGFAVRYVDACSPGAVEAAISEHAPGCVLVETMSNPLLRMCDIERLAELCRRSGAALIVDSTFATPLLVRPLELGAHLVVHSLTKFLAGHGDVLGGAIVSDAEHFELVRQLSRTCGPVLGPFEAYLTMRGVKTFPLRMERQCSNARTLAAWLRNHPKVERVFYLDDPAHPDAAVIRRLLPPGLYGAMVSFEIRDARRDEVFAFLDRLKLVVRATSLGDVHTMVLYPMMSSHREVPPALRDRMGIRENLLRLSTGIEDIEDIQADLDQALA